MAYPDDLIDQAKELAKPVERGRPRQTETRDETLLGTAAAGAMKTEVPRIIAKRLAKSTTGFVVSGDASLQKQITQNPQ